MHELSLCESILRIIQEQAVQQRFQVVRAIHLEVGRLAVIEPDSLRFCFDAVTRGSVAEGARLDIARSDGQAWCYDCNATVTIADRLDPCPSCGGGKLRVTGGDTLRIKELEVD